MADNRGVIFGDYFLNYELFQIKPQRNIVLQKEQDFVIFLTRKPCFLRFDVYNDVVYKIHQ